MSSLKVNFSYALVAQAVSMLISTVIVLLVPRVVGISGYGQLQYFLLISGYVTVLAFGISDGMYLRCGGRRFKDLECDQTSKGEFAILAGLSLIESFVIISISLIIVDESARAFVYQGFALYIPLYLLNNYLGYMLQASNRIWEYSVSSVIERVVCLFAVVFLVTLRIEDFRPYVFAYVIGKLAALCYSVVKCRRVFFGRWPNCADVVHNIREDVPAGLRLTFSTLAAQLILGTGRLFVDVSFGVEEFSQVSLAISMMNFILVFINQVGMVLFPTLRRFDAERLSATYDGLCGSMLIVLPLVFIAYFPFSWFISWWLPVYAAAVRYLGILIPICYFDGKNSMIYATFLKVKRGESELLRTNVIALVVSVILSALFAFGVRSINGVVVSLLVAVAVRNVLLVRASDTSMLANSWANSLAELLLTAAFVLGNLLLAPQCAFIVVVLLSAVYIAALRHQMVVSSKTLWSQGAIRSGLK